MGEESEGGKGRQRKGREEQGRTLRQVCRTAFCEPRCRPRLQSDLIPVPPPCDLTALARMSNPQRFITFVAYTAILTRNMEGQARSTTDHSVVGQQVAFSTVGSTASTALPRWALPLCAKSRPTILNLDQIPTWHL